MAARVLWRLLPSLAVLLAVLHTHAVAVLVRWAASAAVRLLHVAVVASGGVVFWALLRGYQLSVEHEIYDRARRNQRFYDKYRPRTAAAADGFQLKVVKRLPVATHLRTAWALAPELADEIAAFVKLAVRDYVAFWFAPISPHNDEFPVDVQFLLADLLGALVARVLEIDSAQALTMVAKSVELLRLHLGWFREAYAQLAEEHPHAFQGDEGGDASLLHARQELVAAYVQKAKFLHPGCVAAKKPTAGAASATAPGADAPDVLYLRHVATQLLVQLKPELGQQSGTNLFVSLAMNLMRECLVFKGLKPVFEYSQPRYANEAVVAALLAESDDKDSTASASSPVASPTASSGATTTTATAASGSTTGLGFNVPLPQLNSPAIDLPNMKSLRMTKNFLYKASKRSSEQAEAALHAVFDAVSSAASTASSGMSSLSSMGSVSSPTATDMGVFDNDYWSESTAFGIVSPRSPSSDEPLSPQMQQVPVAAPSNERKGGAFASIFSKDDRISFPKTPRIMLPRVPTSAGSTGGGAYKSIVSAAGLAPDTPGSSSTHMEDLKNMKANLESSLNSSLFKVKKTFRNIGGHLQDQSQMAVTTTTAQAANLIKRPKNLFQKALRRSDTSMETPLPTSPIEFPSTPPPLGASQSLDEDDTADECESEKTILRSPTDTSLPPTPNMSNSKAIHMQDRVLLLLEKTTANYIKLYQDRAEMRNSARSRELYELLSALEDVFMLGYRKPGDGVTFSVSPGADTPPGSPTSRRGTVPLTAREASTIKIDDVTGSTVVLLDPQQVYWNYLAQDRPDTPFLNDHWQFVQTACPKCADSESFYSTRGVQWILVALEKGMLWEYFTALNLNRRLTELFYEDIAVLRNGKLMEKVLKTLFQLNKLQVTLEIPHVLGRQSEYEKELGIARAIVAQPQLVRVVESAWEVERYVPIQGWVKSQDKRTKELPSSEWIWESEWTLEMPPARESSELRTTNGPRRSGSAGSDSSDVEASGMWEYGKSTLDNRFHDKEKKLDSVRRRKWTRRRRQLPPVLSLPAPTGTSEFSASRALNSVGGGFSSPRSPQLGAQASPRRHASRQGSWDADDVELSRRGKNPAMLKKRRSFSLDKGSGSPTPVSPATPPPPRLSGVGAVFRRRKERATSGFASLRRSRGARSPDSSKTVAAKSSATLSDDELAGADEEDDDAEEDDGNLCFRCFKALGSRADGASSPTADSCQSCHQRVCASCHNHFAFLVYPPPLESSRKEQVCGSCYNRLIMRYKLKIDAHVGKYFIKESERDGGDDDPFTEGSNGPLSPGQASTSSAGDADSPSQRSRYRFEVTVQVRDESSYAWSVVKSFYDFEQLEKQLHEKLKKQEKKHGSSSACSHRHWRGVDYSELRNVEPSLKQFSSTAATAPYEKKLFVLETFLQRLLQCDTLCQSSVVQKFLLLGDNINNNASSPANTPNDLGDVVSAGGSGPLSPPGSGGATGAASATVMVENGKWRRGKWIAPETNSKETKMRVLQQLEVSLFAILNEVFEFDGIGLLRRHLFSMTRSFIKAFLSASHFRKIERQYLTFTDPKKMAAHLAAFREYMFPETPVEPPPAQLSAAEMQALRKKSLEAILASLPSTIVSVVGDGSSANAALKLHEFLQHEIFLKNLLFSMCDELLPHVFPDTVPYTPKAKPTKALV